MSFVGLRDSSPYMAADSKPTHDQKAKNSPIPAEPATARTAPALFGSGTVPSRFWKALIGLSDCSDQPSGPPPANSTPSTSTASITISATRKTPRTPAAMLILK
jgi:hypothetical protein